MKNGKYKGYIEGLYKYFADNNDGIKLVFSQFFGINLSTIKIAYRREDLELMVLVKIKELAPDAMIIFTVNRLDEYKLNYDNEDLMISILDSYKLGSRRKKIFKIKNNINK